MSTWSRKNLFWFHSRGLVCWFHCFRPQTRQRITGESFRGGCYPQDTSKKSIKKEEGTSDWQDWLATGIQAFRRQGASLRADGLHTDTKVSVNQQLPNVHLDQWFWGLYLMWLRDKNAENGEESQVKIYLFRKSEKLRKGERNSWAWEGPREGKGDWDRLFIRLHSRSEQTEVIFIEVD